MEAGAMERVCDEKRRDGDITLLHDTYKNNLKTDDGRIAKRPVWLRAIGCTK
jgi:hypothetical protein